MRLFKKLDEKGVSPVIGVILMVAITVILAAVIASFVFGMGSKMTQKAPQVMFSARIGSISGTNYLILTDLGGDKVSLNDLQIFLTDQAGNVYPSTGPMLLSGNATTIPSGISTLGAGDKVLISLSTLGIVSPGTYTVTLLYKPTNSVIWSGSVTY